MSHDGKKEYLESCRRPNLASQCFSFSQVHADYYLPNLRPQKKLWLKPPHHQAYTHLCSSHLPVLA